MTQYLLLIILGLNLLPFQTFTQSSCSWTGQERDTTSLVLDRGKASQLNYSNNFLNANRYWAYRIEVCDSADYEVFTCGPGAQNRFNNIVSVYTDSSGYPSSTLIVSDNGIPSGTGSCRNGESIVNWTSTYCGYAWVLLDDSACTRDDTDTAFMSHKIRFRQKDVSEKLSSCPLDSNLTFLDNSSWYRFSTQCAHNSSEIYSPFITDTLSGEDRVFYMTDTCSPPVTIQYVSLNVRNCNSSGSDSIYFILSDTASGIGDCEMPSGRNSVIYQPSTQSFLQNGLNTWNWLRLPPQASLTAQYLIMDPSWGYAECDLLVEHSDYQSWELDTDGDSITQANGVFFCGNDSNRDGMEWTIDTGSGPLPLDAVALNPSDSVLICNKVYLSDNYISGLDQVSYEFGSGWASAIAVSPQGSQNGFHDSGGTWSAIPYPQQLTWDFISSINSGHSGDYYVLSWIQNHRFLNQQNQYNCLPYEFCFQAVLPANPGTNDDREIIATFRQENFDSSTLFRQCLNAAVAVSSLSSASFILAGAKSPPIISGLLATASIQEDSTFQDCFSFSDADLPTGDSISLFLDWAVNGTASLISDTCINYQPDPGFFGTDSVRLIACDSFGLCDTALISLTILPLPDTPVLSFGLIRDTIYTSDTATWCFNVTDADIPYGDSVSCIPTGGAGGIMWVPTDSCLSYAPQNGFTGSDTIWKKACDLSGLCDTGQIIVWVMPDSGTVGIRYLQQQLGNMRIYPNPTEGMLTIHSKGNSTTPYRLEVFNLQGALIRKDSWTANGEDRHSIDLDGLASGIYSIRVANDTEGVVHRALFRKK